MKRFEYEVTYHCAHGDDVRTKLVWYMFQSVADKLVAQWADKQHVPGTCNRRTITLLCVTDEEETP